MQFRTTDEVPFEIPTEWWEGTGMSGFIRTDDYYEVNPNAPFKVIRVSEVAPVRRTPGLEGFSESGFREEKMIPVLRAFRSKIPLPPVEVTEVSKNSADPCGYELHDGMHRYYASIAAGFPHLPVMVRQDVQDLRSMLDEETKAGAETQRLKF